MARFGHYWVREPVPGAWSPEDVSRPLAAGGIRPRCPAGGFGLACLTVDLLAEFFYLSGEDGEEFPVGVKFDRHVDGFGLQFEMAVAVIGECDVGEVEPLPAVTVWVAMPSVFGFDEFSSMSLIMRLL